MQHITWILNVNINVIEFRSTKLYYKCSRHTSPCYLPFFVFQNTLVKLLRAPHLMPTLNIFYFKKRYFISSQMIRTAYLIDTQISQSPFQKISKQNIIDILEANSSIKISFNVILYSTYAFTRHKNINVLNKNIVGNYFLSENTELVQLFISPHLMDSDFDVYLLKSFKTPQCLINNFGKFALSHLVEQDKSIIKKLPKEKVLNQTHCICDHSETQRIFLPKKFSYNIGAKKYYYSY